MANDVYTSPLASRYASPYMLHLFSPDSRFQTWRRLWVALARAQHQLGLPITARQVQELEAHVTDIDYEVAAAREREVRHDVMAHVYAYGKAAPSAAGILHLGATSCYVTDNADLILYRDGLRYLRGQLLSVLADLAAFARRYAAVPTLGYTHYQPAQPVTVGKRATLWMQDFLSDVEELDALLSGLKFLGCRGTTGTEASFMDLFDGDEEKIDEMNRRIAAEFGFSECFPVCGQTYPRKVDSRILSCLSSIAQSAYRMAGDIRLLQHGEINGTVSRANDPIGMKVRLELGNNRAFVDLRRKEIEFSPRHLNLQWRALLQRFFQLRGTLWGITGRKYKHFVYHTKPFGQRLLAQHLQYLPKRILPRPHRSQRRLLPLPVDFSIYQQNRAIGRHGIPRTACSGKLNPAILLHGAAGNGDEQCALHDLLQIPRGILGQVSLRHSVQIFHTQVCFHGMFL